MKSENGEQRVVDNTVEETQDVRGKTLNRHSLTSKFEDEVKGEGAGRLSAVQDGEADDSEIVAAIRRGEAHALRTLWDRYAALLYGQAGRILNNSAETEDVVAEVFEEAWKRVESYRPERARPVAWLLTLARRRAIDRLRERQSYQRAGERLQREEVQNSNGSRNEVEEQIGLSDLRRILQAALEELPKEQRMAVWMAYYEGLTQREISERTGTPIGTVKSRLEMGLKKMREGIRRQCAFYPDEQTEGLPGRGRGAIEKCFSALLGAHSPRKEPAREGSQSRLNSLYERGP
jgi:RNA polymerase sigma-70 factor (ECF subfamily)